MREIKFRAWDITNKAMSVGFEPFFVHPETYSLDCGIPVGDTIHPNRSIDEFIIMQYTGLKDKNGKEIYEGNIVEYRNRVGKIEWLSPQASFDLVYLRTIEGEPFIELKEGIKNNSWPHELEVIGNIYENPDLLDP